MSAGLAHTVDPWRLASRHAVIAGETALRRLPRLAEVLADTGGAAAYELNFHLDESNRVRITGWVRAVLPIRCQRCLETLEFPVDARLDLAVVLGDTEAELLPDTCEAVLANEGAISLRSLVEDELLLALPQIAMHAENLCDTPDWNRENFDAAETGQARDETGKTNPFAVLAGLKTDSFDKPLK